jgi:hypothetical protein
MPVLWERNLSTLERGEQNSTPQQTLLTLGSFFARISKPVAQPVTPTASTKNQTRWLVVCFIQIDTSAEEAGIDSSNHSGRG